MKKFFLKSKNISRKQTDSRKKVMSIIAMMILLFNVCGSVQAAGKSGSSVRKFASKTSTSASTVSGSSGGNVIDLSISYGLQSGKTLYYDSVTNRHYTNDSFTETPQKISAIINKAMSDNVGKGTTLYIPAGEYLIDEPIHIKDGINLTGAGAQTKFIVDDTFDRCNDDFVIVSDDNAKFTLKNISVEYKGFKLPVFGNTKINPVGIEGMILKIRNSPQAVVDNCTFVTRNYGAKTELTPIWIRDGSANVEVKNCTIENTSGELVGGCLWISNCGNNISVHDNKLIRNGRDEAIAVWKDSGSCQDYSIYGNTINCVPGTENATCDKIVAFNAMPGVTFSNFKFSGNNFNITGKASRIIICDVGEGKMSNVVIENNNIKEYTEDPDGLVLITVFEVWTTRLPSETTQAQTYARGDISFNNNTYTNPTEYGRRCLAAGINSLIKLSGNVIDSNFAYSVLFDSTGSVKFVSSGNDYNYTGSGTATFANSNSPVVCTNDKIYAGSTPSSYLSNVSYDSTCFLKV